MKIAIPIEGDLVSAHFGHCENFVIYEIENKTILNKEIVKNPEHQPGFLPGFLKENGADVIIAGGMRQRAKDLFAEKNIEVMVGVTGKIDFVINSYIQGELKSTESFCTH